MVEPSKRFSMTTQSLKNFNYPSRSRDSSPWSPAHVNRFKELGESYVTPSQKDRTATDKLNIMVADFFFLWDADLQLNKINQIAFAKFQFQHSQIYLQRAVRSSSKRRFICFVVV